jgi:hypothetical protein
MFGTCRMGSHPANSVVRPDFRHYGVERLYIADSSVFPTNIGVNPQIPIMALATICARRAVGLAADGGGGPTLVPPCARNPSTPTMTTPSKSLLTLDDLLTMTVAELHAILERGHPLEPDVLAGRQYLGVDLTLPKTLHKLLWQTFRKTFVRDEQSGEVRGWNVKLEQQGIAGPQVPLTNRRGEPITFGHYRIRSAAGIRFPKGWRGPHFLDYTQAGNERFDPAALGYAPLVAVNAGNQDLLLGWEVLKLGPVLLPIPSYWALRYEGPVDRVIAPPRAP